MSLAESFANIETHLKAEFESVKARIEQDLPDVGQFVQDAASNPVIAALSAAVHLPEAPEVLATIADLIGKADAALGAAKAAAAPPEPPAPADPAPAV